MSPVHVATYGEGEGLCVVVEEQSRWYERCKWVKIGSEWEMPEQEISGLNYDCEWMYAKADKEEYKNRWRKTVELHDESTVLYTYTAEHRVGPVPVMAGFGYLYMVYGALCTQKANEVLMTINDAKFMQMLFVDAASLVLRVSMVSLDATNQTTVTIESRVGGGEWARHAAVATGIRGSTSKDTCNAKAAQKQRYLAQFIARCGRLACADPYAVSGSHWESKMQLSVSGTKTVALANGDTEWMAQAAAGDRGGTSTYLKCGVAHSLHYL